MGSFSFTDLQQVAKDAGFSLVPNGEYEAVVNKGVKIAKTSTGKDMFKLAFKIADGKTKGMVFTNLTISPENAIALSIFFRQMSALGLGDKYFAANPSLEKVAKDLEGRRALIEVGTREWQGQDRNEIKSIKPSRAAANDPMAFAPSTSNGVPAVSSGPAPMAVPQVQDTPPQSNPVAVPDSAPQETNGQGASESQLPDDPF